MKTFSRLPVMFWLCLNASLLYGATTANSGNAAALPPPTPYAIVQQDANSQVWERTEYELGPSGEAVPKTHRYTELATGLNHLVNREWMASSEQIDVSPDGNSAAATNGQHRVYFPGNIYNGVIEMDTPDGLKLQSQPIGLSYDDGSNSVLIAVLTNSTGAILPSGNQVIYQNAFTGFSADLLYTYTKAGLEQDVVIRTEPPTPESLGLNPATAKLQVLTEFFNPPQPNATTTTLPEQAGISLTDQALDFGIFKVGLGRAFMIGDDASADNVLVGKQWLQVGSRQILVEEVPVEALANQLGTLPLPSGVSTKAGTAAHPVASRQWQLPPPHLAQVRETGQFRRLAQTTAPTRGLVLDYQTINSSLTNYVFQGDTTYFVRGPVYLYKTNNFEGGTAIKYTNSSSASIQFQSGSVMQCQGSAYRPIVMTSMSDNSVGETISGSTGNPSVSSYTALIFQSSTSQTVSHLRVAYASAALVFPNGPNGAISDAQFVNCGYGLVVANSCSVVLENALFSNMQQDDVILYSYGFLTAENVTFDRSPYLCYDPSGNSFTATNCIVANVTNTASMGGVLSGNHNGFYKSPPFGTSQFTNNFYPFQAAGAGSYYLTNGCVFRNAGTTNIYPSLLADLATKTTYPPIVYANTNFPVATTFSPQAQRDAGDAPDLGYHYDPLDWVFAEDEVDTNVTFTAGTAVGWYRTSSGWYEAGDGLHLMNGATANLIGTATAPVWWVRLNTVQELDTSGGYGPGGLTSWGSGPSTYVATINAQFTHCSMLTVEANHFRDDGCCGGGFLVVNATDCEFYSGGVGAYNVRLCLTNCLFERAIVSDQGTFSTAGVFMQNCTMKGNQLYVSHWSGTTWPVNIQNCAFDRVNLSQIDNPSGTTNNYNAFLQGATQLPSEGPNTVIVTNSFNWQTNWLGNYYQTTNSPLIDKGSTTADQVGLYHFTTQTNQTVEGISIVDIGYHYVAVDQYGNPLDTNGDGIPDYLEDANGVILRVKIPHLFAGSKSPTPETVVS